MTFPSSLVLRLAALLAAAWLFAFPVIAAEENRPATAATGIAPWTARFGRARPVVAVVGHNQGTELFDFVVPYGILARSGVADVKALGLEPGPLKMRPGLLIEPHATIDDFDRQFPQGADYVIVPAVAEEHTRDPRLAQWLQAQAAKGATVASICDGALVVAGSGLFKGHSATGHWATRSLREHDFPETHWLHNVRYVADGTVASSAGVSAAVPLSLALVEAIGGTERASTLARQLGVDGWSAVHDSDRFRLRPGTYVTAALNWLHPSEHIELPIAQGVDELTLAITADALGRTYRSAPYVTAATPDAVRTRGGLLVLPNRAAEAEPPTRHRTFDLPAVAPGRTLDAVLRAIDERYGPSTADLVALQMEYAR